MPKQTVAPGASTYHSGTFRHKWMFPDCYHDPLWISQWKLDDITSGSGLDSKHTNHLIASGSPVNTTGYRQASGMLFDGVNDCLYRRWNEASGLQGCRITVQEDGIAAASNYPHFGFMCSMRVDAFDNDQVIFSKWNEVSSDREWMFGISTSGGLFYGWKQQGVGTMQFSNSHVSGIVPSGQWFDFAIFWQGPDNTSSTNGPAVYAFIDDKLVVNCYGSNCPTKAGASGVFHIGAANFGNTPSGFFKGAMEDVRFYNGRHPSMPNYLAFRSGVSPLTSYPPFTDFNQYIAAHIQLNSLTSGNLGYNNSQSGWSVYEKRNNYQIHNSGTGWKETDFMLAPGASDGTLGSGLECNGLPTSAMSRMHGFTREDSIAQRHSMTISYWVRSERTNASSPIMFGYRTFTGAAEAAGPYNVQLTSTNRPAVAAAKEASTSAQGVVRHFIIPNVWAHCVHVINIEESRVDTWISGIWQYCSPYPTISGLWLADPSDTIPGGDFRIGQQDTNITNAGFSGILDEIVVFGYAMPSSIIPSFYFSQSGFITPSIPESGMLGAYIEGVVVSSESGMLSSYILAAPTASGNIGGWISGIPFYASGMLGAYTISAPTASGNIAGYLWGLLPTQNTIGAYTKAMAIASGYIGGYTRGVEAVDQQNSFAAFFNIVGRTKEEFDAQAKIALTRLNEFDSKAIVYIEEKPPLVNIFIPDVHQSGNFAPYTYHFEAHASGQQGKSVYNTFWFFSDNTATSGSTVTSSGTYSTDHTFTKSGIFDVIFVAIDSNGLVSSDRRIINTASGFNLPTISLTATPQSGLAPLPVSFSGVINSAPSPILDKYIYFGDGTRSASTDSIYKMYPVIGEYIAVFRVRDASGFIVTDSTVVGVNN